MAGLRIERRLLLPRQRAKCRVGVISIDFTPSVPRLLSIPYEAADAAGIRKGVTLHALRHSFAEYPFTGTRHRYQDHPSASGSRQARHYGALRASPPA